MRLSNTSRLAQVAFGLISVAASLSSATTIQTRATICNGHAELCSKSYSGVSYVGTHNSYAFGSDNLAASQDYDVTQQLDDGVRALTVQAHKSSDGVHLCHTTCLLYDAGFIVTYLKKLQAWLVANPTEVVTLVIVNIDNLPAATYAQGYQAAGLVELAYVPPQASMVLADWPTLGAMIDSGKRLVTFMDHQADFGTVPYIIDEFPNMWETPFDVMEQSFPCDVNRTAGATDPSNKMYLINHYLYEAVTIVGVSTLGPAKSKLEITNGVSGPGSLGAEVDTCVAAHKNPPNILLVDYYSYGEGSVFQVAASINGVTYAPTKPIAPPNPTNTATTPGTTSKSLKSGAAHSLAPIGVQLSLVLGLVAGSLLVL
jgi:hypothetical protein